MQSKKPNEFEHFRKTETQLQLQNHKCVVERNLNAKLETTEQRIVTVAKKVDSILILPESISNIVPDPTLVNNCIKKKNQYTNHGVTRNRGGMHRASG